MGPARSHALAVLAAVVVAAPAIAAAPATVVRSVALEGVTRLDRAAAEALFAPLVGAPLTSQALEEPARKLQDLYKAAGYPVARLSGVSFSPDGELRLRVAEGRLYGIRVRGLEATHEEVVLRELTVRVGRLVESAQIDADLRRLRALNLFAQVTVKPEPPPATHPDEVVLVYEVEEQPTGQYELGGNLDPQQGFQGTLSLSQDNLFGWAQHAHIRLAVSQQLQLTGELGYATGWVGDHRLGLSGNLYARRFNNFLGDFREDRTGASVTVTPPWPGPWKLRTGLRAERVGIAENVWLGGAPKPGVALSDSAADTLVSGSLGLGLDTRDDYAYPTGGTAVMLGLDPGLVNLSAPLVRATASVSRFYPLMPLPWSGLPAVLAFDLRGGTLQAFGGRVPGYERFYATGQYLVRGWPEYQAGAVSGGSHAAVGSAELRLPVWGPVSAVVFGDTGISWDTAFRPDALRSGYGLGLRAVTPLGPVRVDYALHAHDQPGQFHFGLGQKF